MNKAIAKIKIAQKDCGLQDEEYRALLKRLTGKTSARDLSDAQAGAVLEHFKTVLNWTPRVVAGGKTAPKATGRRLADSPTANKARALWISLWQLGVVRDRSERALEAFGRRQLGVDTLHWADEQQMYRLIEALKGMAERAGWSQDVSGVPVSARIGTLKLRLIWAQCKRANAIRPDDLDYMTGGQLDQLISDLGKKVRKRTDPEA